MEKVCPNCNELDVKLYKCKKCNSILQDKGRVQEYYDDYSADAPIEDSENYCEHVLKCNKCDIIERINIEKVII